MKTHWLENARCASPLRRPSPADRQKKSRLRIGAAKTTRAGGAPKPTRLMPLRNEPPAERERSSDTAIARGDCKPGNPGTLARDRAPPSLRLPRRRGEESRAAPRPHLPIPASEPRNRRFGRPGGRIYPYPTSLRWRNKPRLHLRSRQRRGSDSLDHNIFSATGPLGMILTPQAFHTGIAIFGAVQPSVRERARKY